MRKAVDIVCITLTSPILVGVYEKNKLIETIKSDKKSSDILPVIFEDLLKRYDIQSLAYAKGPGSFMAIKVAYIFLESLSILKNIPLLACDAFVFNGNKPIKAIGKLYFVKIQDKIETKKLDTVETMEFRLPTQLEPEIFSTNNAPLYSIGAIG